MRHPNKENCYEVVKVYDFFDVMHYLQDTLLWEDAHDDMFEMISYSDQEGRNDSLHRVYRHWLKSDRMKQLFDVICDAFDIPHTLEKYSKNPEDCTRFVMWVSW